MDDANTIPIRRLTLYKHGVCFVERAGSAAGAELRLTFRAEDVNDALKSLLVIDRRGGGVLGMDYTTPGQGRARAGDTFADVSDEHSLRDLLRALRGWSVRLALSDDGDVAVTGRVLGIDVAQPETMFSHTVVALLDEGSGEGANGEADAGTGAVRTVPLSIVRRVSLLDARAERDLRALLDDSRGEDTRVVTVRLSPCEHDLAVSYLVPSPTWRVSYRVVAEPATAEDGQERAGVGGAEGGALLLQGWGLFDNHLEEDLAEVAVTLVAGQPISFVYDLSSSHIPARPVVADEARVAAGPVVFDAMMMESAGAAPRAPSAAAPLARAAKMARSAATIADLAGQEVAAAGSDVGELFQYEVTAPVGVKRGASALVPILSSTLPYRRELLYNSAKHPDHPVAALRFTNGSGLTLERGPATVLDAGAYHGEAIVPFTREGSEVYLAYAVELGIAAVMSSDTRAETAGIAIEGALLHIKSATVTRTTYRLESRLAMARTVTIEHPLRPGWDFVETRPPDARGGAHGRWDVACPARGETIFTVSERRYDWRGTQLLEQSYERLGAYLDERWLDRATLDRLGTLFAERAAMTANDEEVAGLRAERAELYERQEGLRRNMAALGTAGDEGALRGRVVGELAASEERLGAITARIAALKDENARRQTAIDTYLATLRLGDTAPGAADR